MLVVEDTDGAREPLVKLLGICGFDAAGVADLPEAEAAVFGGGAFGGDPPDLVLLDLMLPSGDGAEVLRKIRSTGSPIRVAVLTARSVGLDYVRAMRPDLLLTKPLDWPGLLDWCKGVTANLAGKS